MTSRKEGELKHLTKFTLRECQIFEQNYGNMCLFAAASKCDPQLALKHKGMCGTQREKEKLYSNRGVFRC